MIVLGVGVILSALVLGWLGWLALGARAAREATERQERAELLQTVVKLANRENTGTKLLAEGLDKISTNFNESLVKLMIGYQGNLENSQGTVLDLNQGDNNFPVDPNRQWLPTHELLDKNMWPVPESDLKPTPEGPGGWVE